MKPLKLDNRKYFETKEQYLSFRQSWKEACNNPKISLGSSHYFIYAALCGNDIRKQFSCITQKNIPAKGISSSYTIENIYRRLCFAYATNLPTKWSQRRRENISKIFGEWITQQTLENMINDISQQWDSENYSL